MRRTSSGSDLASSSLFAAPTSYVYMPPQKESYKDVGPERALTVSLEIEMQTHCRGGVVIPRRNDPATGRAYPPYRTPCFTAEITGGLLIGTQCTLLPCLPAQPIFHLPLGAITSVELGESDESLDLCSRWSQCLCVGGQEVALVLHLDAPNGWL